MAALAKILLAVQRIAAASSRWDAVAPGTSASMILSDPGHLRLQQRSPLVHPLLRILRPPHRDVVVQLEEAEVRVHLVDRALAKRRHFAGDLLVAGEQGAGDRIEVIREQVGALRRVDVRPVRS